MATKEYRLKNKDKIKEYNKKWRVKNKGYWKKYFKRNPDKLKRKRETTKLWHERNKEKLKYSWYKYQLKYRLEHPEEEYKFKAREKAKKNIKIKGLCQNCKEKNAEVRHHKDYNKPLDVVLLCKRCHNIIHNK